MIDALILIAVIGLICVYAYALGMWLEGGVAAPSMVHRVIADKLVVFLIPCLNEERVIAATLDRLRSDGDTDRFFLVIDDGSDDATAAIVSTFDDPRVQLLRRTPPDARLGKGAALNAGVQYLLDSGLLDGWHYEEVVVCILDADGRLDPAILPRVLRSFASPRVGAVQIGVRILNRAQGLLPRLQDMEFVAYTQIFQLSRSRFGYATLGGNGQFTRLTALLSLGDEPWTDSLSEDLDLGVRLVLAGWRTHFMPEVSVEQQGLDGFHGLVRQRSRWFQGTLQTWKLVPTLARRSPRRVALELGHTLLSPALVLVTTFMVVSSIALIAGALLSDDPGSLLRLSTLIPWYVLVMFPAFVFGIAYGSASEVSIGRALLLAHVYVLYSLTWMVSGWRALGRIYLGRRSWHKTERLIEERATESDAEEKAAGQTIPAPVAHPAVSSATDEQEDEAISVVVDLRDAGLRRSTPDEADSDADADVVVELNEHARNTAEAEPLETDEAAS